MYQERKCLFPWYIKYFEAGPVLTYKRKEEIIESQLLWIDDGESAPKSE